MNPITAKIQNRIDEIEKNSNEIETDFQNKQNDLDQVENYSQTSINIMKKEMKEYKSKLEIIKKRLEKIILDVQNKGKIEDIQKIKNAIEKLELENKANYKDLKFSIEKIKSEMKNKL